MQEYAPGALIQLNLPQGKKIPKGSKYQKHLHGMTKLQRVYRENDMPFYFEMKEVIEIVYMGLFAW